jgi:hypothetical protein
MAAVKDKGEASAAAGGDGSNPSLEALLRSLQITGDDLEGLFVPKEEVKSLREDSKWMAVVKLLSSKPFSAVALEKTMRFAWAPAQEVTFSAREEGRFLVKASCLGDWQKITEQGPWLFREQGVLIEKYDGSCKVSSVELNRIHAWVQIHDVPELFRKKSVMTGLAANIGEVLAVDMTGGEHVRARVWLDVRKPIPRFVSIKPEGEAPIVKRVKYEKIPRYCSVCGMLGHVKEECGPGEHSPGKEGFGLWLLADTVWNRNKLTGAGDGDSRPPRRETRPTTADAGRGGGRSGTGGRGRGTGRGSQGAPSAADSRKRTSTDAKLTEASPIKDPVQQASPPLMLEWKTPGVIGIAEDSEAKKKLDFGSERVTEHPHPRPAGTPPPPPSAREQKRPKKHTITKKDKNNSESAGSKEHRLDQ